MVTKTVTQPKPGSREEVETLLWRWSGWQPDQRGVDEVLDAIDRHVRSKVEASRVAGTRQPALDIDAIQETGRRIIVDAQREADEILNAASQGAQQITQAAHDEAQAHPTAKPADVSAIPLEGFQDAEGVLWVKLGPVQAPDAEKVRKCTRCRDVKSIEKFRPDIKARGQRRTMCRNCENVGRRARDAARKGAVTKGVR